MKLILKKYALEIFFVIQLGLLGTALYYSYQFYVGIGKLERMLEERLVKTPPCDSTTVEQVVEPR